MLALCDEMAITNPHGYMDGELYDRLAPHFSDGEIFEIGMTMAVLSGMAKFLFCFDLAKREETCPIRQGA